MFLRLASCITDDDSRQPQGIFMAAHDLLNSGDLSNAEWADLRSLMDWFNDYLPAPEDNARYTMSHRAIFWYRGGSASKFVRKSWEMAQLLRWHGHPVTLLKTDDPGSIVYCDDYQVAAIALKCRRREMSCRNPSTPLSS